MRGEKIRTLSSSRMLVNGEKGIVHFPFCMNNGVQNVGSWRMPDDVGDTLICRSTPKGRRKCARLMSGGGVIRG